MEAETSSVGGQTELGRSHGLGCRDPDMLSGSPRQEQRRGRNGQGDAMEAQLHPVIPAIKNTTKSQIQSSQQGCLGSS